MRLTSPISFRLPALLQPVDRILRNLDKRIRELALVQILNGRLIEGIEVSTTAKEVGHGLGRIPRGAIVVSSTTAVSYSLGEFNVSTFQVASSSGTPTASFWVF